jgi:L-lysine epsilon oxidase C-terminal domain
MVEPGEISEDPNPIKRFSALTKLQYDRFRNWKDDKFTVVDPKDPAPAKIEDVDLSAQPESLTRAHLELTIGDPLFPGIEMWWLAKLNDTVGLH